MSSATRLLNPQQSFLLVIDIQERFRPVIHQMDDVIHATGILIEAAVLLDIPIVITEQYPKGLGSTVESLMQAANNKARVFEKTTFSALGVPDIKSHIDNLSRNQVMVCGIEAHVCVNQSVHPLLSDGYQVHLMSDAISSRQPEHSDLAIRKMVAAGATESTTEMALFELIKDSTHPQFKHLQQLIK